MAKKILIVGVVAGTRTYEGGTEFDTATDAADLAIIASAGGVLVPKENAVAAAAAVLATDLKKRGGLFKDSPAASLLMLAAISAQALPQVVQGALVAGVLVINTGITVTAATRARAAVVTPGGTLGVAYKFDYVVGGPGVGSVTVTSLTTAGATQTLDTSTLDVSLTG